ncbi:MAG: hypothetical protein DLM66_12875 [Candidatus Dormiibacter spiritus]|nr:MAG: hypothetical protein DLM66_12875 [Candidatus Dormibacteraeota bacterium]
MAYADVSVVVNGALDEERTFTDQLLLDDYVAQVGEEAGGDGYPTEVFVVWHEHDPDVEECECAQFLTNHHPYAAWNTGKGVDG